MERRAFVVRGIVQGVGFRPFVYGIARQQALGGFVLNDGEGVVIEVEGDVLNDGEGVVIEVEGDARALERFAQALVDDAPPLAQIDSVETRPLEPRGETTFRIEVTSRQAAPH